MKEKSKPMDKCTCKGEIAVIGVISMDVSGIVKNGIAELEYFEEGIDLKCAQCGKEPQIVEIKWR